MAKEYYHDIDLNANQLFNSRLHNIGTTNRVALGLTLTTDSKGFMVYDTDVKLPFFWDGTTWQQAGGTWGNIAGVITNQTDLINYLITTNIPEGANLYYTNTRARTAISLTTTGSSGAASYSNTTGILNIPTYTLTGLGGVSSTLTSGNILVGNASNIATGVALTLNSATGAFGLSNTGVLTIPDANGTTTRGFVNTGAQIFGGVKTFSSAPVLTGMASASASQYKLLATNNSAVVNVTPNLIWDNTILGLGIGKAPSTGKALDVNGNVAISSLATASTGTYKMVVSSGTLGSLSLQDIPSISGESYNGQFYSECIQSTYSVSSSMNMSFEITDFTNGIVMDGAFSFSTNYVSVTGNVLTLNSYVNFVVFNESAYLVGTGFETFTLSNAAISGTTLTFTSGSGYYGFPKVGDIIIGPGVADNTRVVAYDQVNQLITVSIPQTVSITNTMYLYGTKILSKISGTTYGIGSTYLLNNSLVTSITNQLVSLYNFKLARLSYNGKYNIQFTAQFKNTDTVAQDVNIWLAKSGLPIEESKNTITVPPVHGGSNTPGYAIASWGYIVDAIANDYFGILWKSTNTNTVTLESSPAGVGDVPSTPACSLRITVVSGLVSGTALGSINYMSVTSTGGNYIILPDNTGTYLPNSTDVEITYGAVAGGPLGGIYLRIPTAGSSSTIARGLVSNTTQSFYGNKTFVNNVTITGTSLHTGVATFTLAPVFSSTTASTLLTVGSGKALASLSTTGILKVTAGVPSVMTGTANALTYWTDANTISFLNTTTYPTLTELTFLKGVTSDIQTQLGNKQPLATNLTSLAGLTYLSNSFVKMSAAGTFILDTNTYINSLNGQTGAAQTFANDTNITITSSTNTHTLGWSGQLSVGRGGTGVGSITGIVVGTGSTAMTAINGATGQLLRRNLANTAYEFFSPNYLTANQTITLSGDVSGTGGTGISTTIGAGAVTLAKMANLAANSIIGNNTGVSATPLALTGTQVTAMLDVFSSSAKGLTPASGGGTTNFLRADGTWAAPPGGGGGGGTFPYPGGQIAFSNDDNWILGDVNFFWDNNNKWLGIGTDSPNSMLQVNGTTTITGAWNSNPTNGLHLSFDSDISKSQIYSVELDVGWKSLNIEGFPIILNSQSGGNVGIGITSPGAKLHVVNSDDIYVATFEGPNGYPIQIITVDENLSVGYNATKGSIGNSPTGLYENQDGTDGYNSWRKMTRPYRSYVAQLTQNGTDAPNATILENDLGYTPTWSRQYDGEYLLQATEFGSEIPYKVVVFLNIGNYVQAPMEIGFMAHAVWSKEDNRISLTTSYYDGNTNIPGFLSADNLLSDEDGFYPASFELRIYD